jgi:2,3-bisphosphoglycerate-independent phosphoglycerate mutase
MASAFLRENFNNFERKKVSNFLMVTMTEYDKTLAGLAAFKSAEIESPLSRIVSENGLKQLHIAETEKHAHITYFLNGGKQEPFENEERIIIPSPNVSSYIQTPEMSAEKITEAVISNLKKYDFIAVNFSNVDIVGHTGDFRAIVKAFEVLDSCARKIIPKILEIGGVMIITADHGNAEEKLYKLTGKKRTMHSANPVPFYLLANDFKKSEPAKQEEINRQYKEVEGTLSDIAPTILDLLNLKKPDAMTGQSLLNKL